jgi:hypothetical protein
MVPRHSGVRILVPLAVILLLVAGNLPAIDVWDQASPNDDTPANTRNVIIPGDPAQRHDVEAKAGPAADQDWYRLVVTAGHSYEVRVGGRQEDCFDFTGSNFRVLQSDTTTEITTGVDYPGTGIISSWRATFVAPTNENVFVQLVGNSSCNATSEYTIQMFDTTILNPGWSTGGGFNTFYSLQNATNFTISMTVTLFNGVGTQVASTNFMVAPGQLVATNTQALGIAVGQFGTARVTHTGPPEGILCDAAIANFGTSPAAIIPSKCQRALKGD